MTYKLFLPDDNLIIVARQTITILAYIGAAAAILAGGAGLLYILIWFCSVLTTFIHTFALLCQVAYVATNSSWVFTLAGFIFLLLINVKLACLLFPSLPSFFVKSGGRL